MDIGGGRGDLAISVGLNFDQRLQVSMVDRNDKALDTAREAMAKAGLGPQVSLPPQPGSKTFFRKPRTVCTGMVIFLDFAVGSPGASY